MSGIAGSRTLSTKRPNHRAVLVAAAGLFFSSAAQTFAQTEQVSKEADSVPASPTPGDALLGDTLPGDTLLGDALKITSVDRRQASFNPSAGEAMPLHIVITKAAKVSLDVYGPNREHVAQVWDWKACPAGPNVATWGGKDWDGAVVPDESYTFEVRAIAGEESAIWDPLLDSGGELLRAAEVQTLDARRLSYQLPVSARVLVRTAIVNGPLLRTIVNWEPRGAGLCVESWDGRDADGLREVAGTANAKTAVSAVSLPNQAVITTGNTETDYRQFYVQKGKIRPHKEPRPRVQSESVVLSPTRDLPVHVSRDPTLSLTLGGQEGATPTPAESRSNTEPSTVLPTAPPKSGVRPERAPDLPTSERTVILHVDVPDQHERAFLLGQKFEMIVYVNDQRQLEIEQGHLPFNYPWDTSALSNGRYLLTVNLSTYRNHVGTVSRYVVIER